MKTADKQLRSRHDRRNFYYDVFNISLLSACAVLLLPAWLRMGGEYRLEVLGQLTPTLLPATLGFLLVLRCRAIDLSVWVTMSLGSATAAVLIRAGVTPGWAFLAATVVGAAVGCLNGALVAGLKWPSWLVTSVVGLAGLGIIRLCCGGANTGACTMVPETAFDGWVIRLNYALDMLSRFLGLADRSREGMMLIGPLLTLRMLIVAGSWGLVMLVMLLFDMRVAKTSRFFGSRKTLFLSLATSGALAAVSGICWILDTGETLLASRLVDGLVIPAAAILAGGFFLRGRGRTMLAGICLPVALLIASLWQQLVWPTQVMGYSRQLLLLVAMIVEIQLAFIWCFDNPPQVRRISLAACGLSLVGLLIMPYTTQKAFTQDWVQYTVGLGIWAIGVILLGVSVLAAKGEQAPDDSAADRPPPES